MVGRSVRASVTLSSSLALYVVCTCTPPCPYPPLMGCHQGGATLAKTCNKVAPTYACQSESGTQRTGRHAARALGGG